MYRSGLVDTLVTHANMKGFGLTPLSGDQRGYMPPQLKTKTRYVLLQIERIPSHCLGNRIALSMVSASLLWQLTKSSKVYSLGTRLTLRYSSLEFFMLNFRTFSRHETRYFKILNAITTVVS